jgi:hypothetical protein
MSRLQDPAGSERGAAWLLWFGCLLSLLVALCGPAPAHAQSPTPAASSAEVPDASVETEVPDGGATPWTSPAPWLPGAAEPALDPNASKRGLGPRSDGKPVPDADRPPGSLPDDGGPSPVIFPAQDVPLRFNHERHVKELKIPCTACHDKARTSHVSADSLIPLGTRCDGCHGSDHRDLTRVVADPKEPISQCAFCHAGYRDGARVAPVVIPKPNLRFDHALHVGRNIGCAQCHGAVQNVELATRDQLPRMRGCFNCHQMPEPVAGGAQSACKTCHLTDPNGLMRVSYDSGTLTPPSWLHAAAHGPDWVERHKLVAGDDSRFCSNCHSEKYCTDCHDGRVRPRRVHPNDWLSMHPSASRESSIKCVSCHREQSFCLGCHQRAGVTMSGPYANVIERGRFHPPKTVWTDPPRTPSHHAWQAERNLSACVSCHVERDCAICHATAGIRDSSLSGQGAGGQGINPHPANFANHCRGALRQNARPCLVCHAATDSELQSCR